MTVLCLNGIVSCSSSPPLRQISPLGNAFCCFEEIFFLIILIKSAKGITARLTTKSNVRFSSSARAWRNVTFFSPIAFATSVATRTFLPILSFGHCETKVFVNQPFTVVVRQVVTFDNLFHLILSVISIQKKKRKRMGIKIPTISSIPPLPIMPLFPFSMIMPERVMIIRAIAKISAK